MNTKYYTPSIEEFQVGFELERINQELLGNQILKNIDSKVFTQKESELNKDDFFRPHLITPVDIQFYFLNPHCLGDFRVKYIDQEDIESLGFKLSDDVCPYNGKIIFKTDKKSDGFMDGYICHYELYFTNSKKIMIYKISYGGFTGNENNKEKVFDGYLKNKSELNRLMQQL